ncbi:MAG TPA: hypothetical protein EYQ83_00430 [Acidobacteria bacterium]|nr:hypothetical protein [Acidobacteriota bacterium]
MLPRDQSFVVIPETWSPALTIEPPRVLAEGNVLPSLGPERPYDVSPDGESFVVITPESGTGPRSPRDTIFV